MANELSTGLAENDAIFLVTDESALCTVGDAVACAFDGVGEETVY